MKNNTGLATHACAEQLDVDRLSLQRWIAREGIKPIRTDGQKKYYDLEVIRGVVERNRKKKRMVICDPVTGLPWALVHEKEKALKLRNARELEEKRVKGEWMSVATHHEILSALVSQLEQIPGKLKSELGLTDSQTLALRKALDDARNNAADKTEKK